MIATNINRIIALACSTLLLSLISACGDDSSDDGVSGSSGMVVGTGGAGTTATGSGGAGMPAVGSGGAVSSTGGSGATGGAGGTGMMDASGTNDGSTATGTDAAIEAAVADAAEVPEGLDYSDTTLWMCTPGAAENPCEENVQATEVMADDTKGTPVSLTVKKNAAFDSFYVYPTVDLNPVAGNHTNLTDVDAFKAMATRQAARFSTVCRVYAPFYRQMTIGTYQSPDFQTYFDVAYNDVSEAFDYYMAKLNGGRNIVLIGHSQGTHILTRLLSEKFVTAPEMRDKLISALLIGSSDIFVPTGQKVGGTFANIPLCSSDTQTGCVVAYNSVSAESDALFIGVQQPAAGQQVACTNPAALSGGSGKLVSYVSTVAYPAEEMPSFTSEIKDVSTPTALFTDYFSAQCSGTVPALVITPAPASDTELRTNPYDFAVLAQIMEGSTNSLHLIDIDLAQGTLVDLVHSQGNAKLSQ